MKKLSYTHGMMSLNSLFLVVSRISYAEALYRPIKVAYLMPLHIFMSQNFDVFFPPLQFHTTYIK